MSNLNLSEILATKKTLTIWVPFSDGVSVELEYAEPEEIKRMLKKSKAKKYVRHQEMVEYSDDLYAVQLMSKVKCWRGLTLGTLTELVNIDVPQDQMDTPVEFNQENLETMLKNVPGFLSFVSNTVQDLSLFRDRERGDRVKK